MIFVLHIVTLIPRGLNKLLQVSHLGSGRAGISTCLRALSSLLRCSPLLCNLKTILYSSFISSIRYFCLLSTKHWHGLGSTTLHFFSSPPLPPFKNFSDHRSSLSSIMCSCLVEIMRGMDSLLSNREIGIYINNN